MESNLNFLKMEDNLNFFFNGREPNFFGKWKMLEYARIKYCYKI